MIRSDQIRYEPALKEPLGVPADSELSRLFFPRLATPATPSTNLCALLTLYMCPRESSGTFD